MMESSSRRNFASEPSSALTSQTPPPIPSIVVETETNFSLNFETIIDSPENTMNNTPNSPDTRPYSPTDPPLDPVTNSPEGFSPPTDESASACSPTLDRALARPIGSMAQATAAFRESRKLKRKTPASQPFLPVLPTVLPQPPALLQPLHPTIPTTLSNITCFFCGVVPICWGQPVLNKPMLNIHYLAHHTEVTVQVRRGDLTIPGFTGYA